jgi:protein-tyrosine phosphatase
VSVLFICTGNYYRSRFAEAVFNEHASRRRDEASSSPTREAIELRAISRGLATWMVDGDLSPFTRRALEARGIPAHRTAPAPTQLTEADLAAASIAVALDEAEHRPMMLRQFPGWAFRVRYWDVGDIPVSTPEVALPAIERRVLALLDELT